MKLYNYQKKHVERLVDILRTRRGAMDLSATGTGKTICALSVAKILKKPACVIAPIGTLPGWERTANELGVKLSIVNYESLTRSRGFLDKVGGVVRIEKNSLVIYDEAHRCKHYKSLNSKNMLRISRAGFKILALSATIAHHAEHLRAWNEAFNFANSPSFSAFMYACGNYYEKNKWGGSWLPQPQALEKTRRVIAPFSSVMTIEDAKEMFKENSISVEVISSKEDTKLAKIYAETFKLLRKADKKSSGDHLTAMLRARQASEHAKVSHVLELIEEMVGEGYSVAVFCNFNQTLDAIKEKLSHIDLAEIRGGQTTNTREMNRRFFQDNVWPVILCNLASGGVGLDLHDLKGRPRYTIILPSWSAVDLKQALGRIHRAGAKSPAIQKILYSDVPVEKRIAEAVRNKIHALDTLHDSEVDTLRTGEKTK